MNTIKAALGILLISAASTSGKKAIDVDKHVYANAPKILIAGSANMDTFLPIHHLPSPGENLLLLDNHHPFDAPGGKGCNQAIACEKLLAVNLDADADADVDTDAASCVRFVGRIGQDEAGIALRQVLQMNKVDIEYLQTYTTLPVPTGRGYVFLEKESGQVSAVISGGCNLDLNGWKEYLKIDTDTGTDTDKDVGASMESESSMMKNMFSSKGNTHRNDYTCLMLQREIPEYVNRAFAQYAKSKGMLILQDIGGEERGMDEDMMGLCDYLMPNLTELERLVLSVVPVPADANADADANENLKFQLDPTDHETIIQHAKRLQEKGAHNVLVTLGGSGSILVQTDGNVVFQPAVPLRSLNLRAVDETGAGDCYRAAFAVALLELKNANANANANSDNTILMRQCMEFASAAGALAVTKEGAVPSIPSRGDVDTLLQKMAKLQHMDTGVSSSTRRVDAVARGGGFFGKKQHDNDNNTNGDHVGDHVGDDTIDDTIDDENSIVSSTVDNADREEPDPVKVPFPYMFGSRLNSMKDRPELWSKPVDTVREWVRRQGTIQGLGCVDFNYPQHFHSWSPAEAKASLEEAGLVAGAVCLRYPSKFARGAMNHPSEDLRREAIEMTKEAAVVAKELGCDEVVIWSAYDGYDYPFQVNYKEKWGQLVSAFQECCDDHPDIKWSLEFKPTDENTRFFTVPSTGAAMLLIKDIDRSNMGLTMDVGHMLMAGENPAQSIAMVGDRMFGIQLNDGYTRLAAEDGMMFGSIHPTMALEIMYQLQETNFAGHLYFDTFPQRTDPVREAEYNIESAIRFWKAARAMRLGESKARMDSIMREHDAIGAMEMINDALKSF